MSRERIDLKTSKDQHLMTNQETIEKIVDAASIKRGDRVVEIGAGEGALTKKLVMKGARITAIEMDERFKGPLGKLNYGNVEIIYGNALDIIDKIEFNKIVSNIPYSICEPLLSKLGGRNFDLAVISIPENFYKTISSRFGEKNYSVLTIRTESFFRVECKFKIPKGDFNPVPKTESVVVVIKPLSKADYEKDPRKFILREIFLQKKKKLGNSLMEALINLNKNISGKNFTKKMARKAIKKMRLGAHLLGKRPAQMSKEDFGKIREKLIISL
jgi:16S rRNA A1518/A1519 N6-dimethyltransferase RsmA/KsgA/DIM1 with predicted DNA glycosylase/AP lyase activity